MWYGDEYIYIYNCAIVCTWWILMETLGLIWRNSMVKVEEGKKNKNLNTRNCVLVIIWEKFEPIWISWDTCYIDVHVQDVCQVHTSIHFVLKN
jgi:hypothetical protein